MRDATNFAVTALAAAGLAVAVAGIGCGNNLQSEDAAQVSLEAPSGQGLELAFPCQPHKPGEPSAIQVESQGKKPLKITSIETSGIPDRIQFRGEETETSCTFDDSVVPSNDGNDDCTGQQFCDDISDRCHEGALPSDPITLEQDTSAEFRFFIAAANRDDKQAAVDCPDPGPDVPENLQDDYCGEVTIETNAKRNEGRFTDGNVTLYFQVDSSRRGVIEIVENSLNFTGVESGKKLGPKEFSVRNNSPNDPLTISKLQVQEHPDLVEIDPGQSPIDIGPSSQQTFSVTVDVPPMFDISKLKKTNEFINFESSAVNGCSSTITVNYGSEKPAILLDKEALTFGDTNPQPVTAENVGTEQLLLNRFNFDPPNLGMKYAVKYNGTEIGSDKNSWAKIPAGESDTFEVEFTGSSGGVGELRLTHNDDAVGGESTIILLGNEDAGFGDVIPEAANFNYGVQEKKTFVVWNRGTAALTLNPQLGSPNSQDAPVGKSNFQVNGFTDGGPIPAGSVRTGTIEFDGTSGTEKSELNLEFQSDTAGDPMIITITVTEEPQGTSLTPKITSESGDTVEVGQIARFNSADSGGNSSLSGDTWFLLDRPDGSAFYKRTFGETEFTVRPDVAGTYKIGFAAVEDTGSGTLQEVATFELTAEAPSN